MVAHAIATNTGTTTATTSAVNTAGAKRIYVFVSYYGSGTAPTISDSLGNTWTACSALPPSTQKARLYYCNSPTVGAAHTFTATGTGSYPTICMAAFSTPVVSGALDINLAATGSGSGLVNPAGSGATPAHNSEIIVTGTSWGAAGASAATVSGGYTVTDQVNYSAGIEGGALAYLIQTTATATNPQWNVQVINANGAAIASFQA